MIAPVSEETIKMVAVDGEGSLKRGRTGWLSGLARSVRSRYHRPGRASGIWRALQWAGRAALAMGGRHLPPSIAEGRDRAAVERRIWEADGRSPPSSRPGRCPKFEEGWCGRTRISPADGGRRGGTGRAAVACRPGVALPARSGLPISRYAWRQMQRLPEAVEGDIWLVDVTRAARSRARSRRRQMCGTSPHGAAAARRPGSLGRLALRYYRRGGRGGGTAPAMSAPAARLCRTPGCAIARRARRRMRPWGRLPAPSQARGGAITARGLANREGPPLIVPAVDGRMGRELSRPDPPLCLAAPLTSVRRVRAMRCHIRSADAGGAADAVHACPDPGPGVVQE